MDASLGTTNLMLAIMTAVSVLEGLVLLGVAIAALMVYRRVRMLLNVVEERHVAPAMAQVGAILTDVKHVTERVKSDTERVDQAIRTTIDRVDDTAERVRSNVRAQTSRVIGVMRGARVAVETFFQARPSGDGSHGTGVH